MSSVRPVSAACDPNPEYTLYLQSERWRKLRIATFLRAKGKCEICRRADAREVAHLTYDRIFNELLTDVIACCKPCHREMDSRWKSERQHRGQPVDAASEDEVQF